MRTIDYDMDSFESRLDALERTVADLVGEVLRMRNTPDLAARVGDLEYRLGLAVSDTGPQDASRRLDTLTRTVAMLAARHNDSDLLSPEAQDSLSFPWAGAAG